MSSLLRLPGVTSGRATALRSPNGFPAHRLGRAPGQGADAPVACVRAKDLRVERLEQRSQIVFTHARGRDVVFWQSPRTRKQSRPDVRLPTARAQGIEQLEIIVDAHERYPFKFASQHPTAPSAPGPSSSELRAWARANGLAVSDRGRVSRDVRQAWETAHSEAVAQVEAL
jgi:hypothetical protein